MRIKLNAYRRKDGTFMLYANNDRRVSIGISEDRGMPAPYGRETTAGQRNLIEALPAALEAAEATHVAGVPNYASHGEPKARLPIGDLYITDTATIGGVSTGSDGAFLVRGDKVINLSHWLDSDTDARSLVASQVSP